MGSQPKLNGRAGGWPEVAFHGSTGGALALGFVSLAFSLLGAGTAFGYFGDVEPWSKGWVGGWLCLLFFPVCAVGWFRQAFASGAVVAVGPQGVRDTRVSPDWIPWEAITGLSTASVRGTQFLMVAVDPAFEARMTLTSIARWARPANAALGYRGLGIGATGLRGSFDALKRSVEEGWAKGRGG